jgi:hypothetical protein
MGASSPEAEFRALGLPARLDFKLASFILISISIKNLAFKSVFKLKTWHLINQYL